MVILLNLLYREKVHIMNFTIITVAIAVVALISPIIVALVNNNHTKKMTAMNYKHESELKELSYKHESEIKDKENLYNTKKYQWDTYNKNATDTFMEMLTDVSTYLNYPIYIDSQSKAISSINKSITFADDGLEACLGVLLKSIDDVSQDNPDTIKKAMKELTGIARLVRQILAKDIIKLNEME